MDFALLCGVIAVSIEAKDTFVGYVCGKVIDDIPAGPRIFQDADDGTLRCRHCYQVLEDLDNHDCAAEPDQS
jgi:hypothetical protein